MRPLSDTDLLRVWELGQRRPSWQRALLMLAPALPELSQGQLADLSLGQRNAYLFLLRGQALGQTIEALAICPQCRLKIEFSLQVDDICVEAPSGSLPATQTVRLEDIDATFRHLTSRDLALVTGRGLAFARGSLIRRAIVQVRRAGVALDVGSLPQPLIAAIGEQIREADPLAEMRFQMECPACRAQWAASFDIAAFVWTELAHLAQRLIGEIHQLASAYGWREADILSLSAQRRRAYLDVIGT